MSMHRSLKTKPSGLNQHRNVLTRDERLARLTDQGEFDPAKDSPIGIVKVGNRAVVAKKPKKEETEAGADGEATTDGETPSA